MLIVVIWVLVAFTVGVITTYVYVSKNSVKTGAIENSVTPIAVEKPVGQKVVLEQSVSVKNNPEPKIVWSFDVVTKPGEQTERRKEIVLTIDGKVYKTRATAIGCGKDVLPSELFDGQLSATICGPYADSANEFAVYKLNSGFKVTKTDLTESLQGTYIVNSTKFVRGSTEVLMNIAND
jgi:hypothetical protein